MAPVPFVGFSHPMSAECHGSSSSGHGLVDIALLVEGLHELLDNYWTAYLEGSSLHHLRMSYSTLLDLLES